MNGLGIRQHMSCVCVSLCVFCILIVFCDYKIAKLWQLQKLNLVRLFENMARFKANIDFTTSTTDNLNK